MKANPQLFKSVRGQYEPAYYLSDRVVHTRAYQGLRSEPEHGTTSDTLESWEAWNANVEEVLTRPSPPRESSVTANDDHTQKTPSRDAASCVVARSLLDSVNRAESQPKVFAVALESTSSRSGKSAVPKSTRQSRLALYRSAIEYNRRGHFVRSEGDREAPVRDCHTPSLVARSASRSSAASSRDDTVYGSDIFDPNSVEEQVELLSQETSERTAILFEYFAATTDIQRELTVCLVATVTSPREQTT